MIKANFNAYNTYVTDSLYQWDLDQVLSVSGLNLAVVPEVHFSNANMDRAIVRQATKVNNIVCVPIPNSLLQDPLTISAHIGIYEDKTFKVVERVEIPIIARKRPNDYQIQGADEEIYSFKALENAVANMVTHSEAKAISARIDNIIAHNNDTDGNTELVDIRVGANGVSYLSAGESVRKQIALLDNDAVSNKRNIIDYCGEFRPRFNWTQGSLLNPSYTTRIMTPDYTRALGDIRVSVATGYKVGVIVYDLVGGAYEATLDTDWKTGEFVVTDVTGLYYRVHICKETDENIAVGESENVSIVEEISESKLKTAYDLSTANDVVVKELFEKVFTDIVGEYVPVHEWESGSYVSESYTSSDRLRTKHGVFYKSLGEISVTVAAGYRVGVRLYDLNDDGSYTMAYDSGWKTEAFSVPNSAGRYYRVCISDADGVSSLELLDYQNIKLTYVLNNDSELKVTNRRLNDIEATMFKLDALSATVPTIAHRGDVSAAPQGTAPSYIAAKKRGHTIAENDLYISKDGEFVMWHDPTLGKLGNIVDVRGFSLYTDGDNYYWYDNANDQLYTYENDAYVVSEVSVSGLSIVKGADHSVADFDLATLKRMDFGKWYGNNFAGTQILTFTEWVLLCKKLGLSVYVDYKVTYTKDQAKRLVDIVRRYGMLNRTSWICNTTTANYIREYDPSARIGFLTNPTEENIETYSPYLAGGSVFYDGKSADLTRDAVVMALDAGFDVECYYVEYGNSSEDTIFTEIRRLVEIGVQAITVDHYHVSEAFKYLLE